MDNQASEDAFLKVKRLFAHLHRAPKARNDESRSQHATSTSTQFPLVDANPTSPAHNLVLDLASQLFFGGRSA